MAKWLCKVFGHQWCGTRTEGKRCGPLMRAVFDWRCKRCGKTERDWRWAFVPGSGALTMPDVPVVPWQESDLKALRELGRKEEW